MGTNYNKFLQSEWWKYLRQEKLKKENCCYFCKSKSNLQIHHYNYKYKYSGSKTKACWVEGQTPLAK